MGNRLIAEGVSGKTTEAEIATIEREDLLSPATTGLTIAEGKTILEGLQKRTVAAQVEHHGVSMKCSFRNYLGSGSLLVKRGGELAEQKASIRVVSPDARFHRLFIPSRSKPASSVLPQRGSFTKSAPEPLFGVEFRSYLAPGLTSKSTKCIPCWRAHTGSKEYC
jgi:hypothetical protein